MRKGDGSTKAEREARNKLIVADAATMTIRQLEAKYGVCFTGIALILKQNGVAAVYDRSRKGIVHNWRNRKVRTGQETELTCVKCEATKPVELFHSIGFVCQECHLARIKQWQDANSDTVKAAKTKSGIKHRDKHNAKGREYYRKTPEKQYERGRLYRLKHRARLNKKAAQYIAHRTKTDRFFRIKVTLSERIRRILRGIGGKRNSTSWLMGISHADFIKYIESKFKPGMTWANYGHSGWHLDHIRPCASFPDLSDINQQKECFHYTNYQPLWALENLRKSKKWNPENKIDCSKNVKSKDVIDTQEIERCQQVETAATEPAL